MNSLLTSSLGIIVIADVVVDITAEKPTDTDSQTAEEVK
jgi:hypothetical protein